MSYKLFLSDEVVNFIENFNLIQTSSIKDDTSSKIYFIDTVFKATEDPNIFEAIGRIDLIESYAINNEAKDNN
jgi:hypothetical protein